ncbi:MAG: hypothetical protein AAF687_07475 [Pseudomonadota bacterium]
MNIRRFALAALASTLLAGCGFQGEYYDATPEQATFRIKNAPMPTPFLGTGVARKEVITAEDGSIVTLFKNKAGKTGIQISATITPDGEGSRIATSVVYDKSKLGSGAESAMASGLITKLGEEHVAAAVEKRPFDMMFAAGPMAKGMMANNPGMAKQMQEANRMASEMAQAQRRGSYDSEYGGWGSENGGGSGADWGN